MTADVSADARILTIISFRHAGGAGVAELHRVLSARRGDRLMLEVSFIIKRQSKNTARSLLIV